MNFNFGIGKPGVVMAALVAIALCVLSYLFHPVEITPLQYGLCLPSPDSWDFNPFWSWIINLILIACCAILIWLTNRSYNYIRTTDYALIALFLIMTCSGSWFTQGLNTSVLLCLANIVSMGIIFSTYDVKNATHQMFILGLVIGIGSMFQYAFLPMACVYLLWALFMKVERIKETLAFLMGIICPYWIALGTGWLNFTDFHFPSLNSMIGEGRDHSDIWLFLAGIAIAAAVGFIVNMINFMKLYAGNSRVNNMNLCVSTLGVASVICILVDFDNMPAYVVSLYFACAAQLANICALWNPKAPWTVTVIPSFFYIAIFVCEIIF